MSHVVAGTAGHIDHGKSALVKALTGTDPDRLPEEKERGITIDLGFAHAAWDGVTFSFVDVPGHERFVRTMVAGAQGIDLALLVVASDDAVMPQTREHMAILQLLGVTHGVLVRTKADLVDEESGAVVEEEIRSLVSGTFLEGAPLVAVSSLTGRGLPELRAALAGVARTVPARDADRRPARLAVDRAFAMKGFGPVVTGTLESGRIRPGDGLTLLPEGLAVRVRRVEVHGQERPEAAAGERTSLNLAGVGTAELQRGQTLIEPGSLEPSRILTVEIRLLPSVGKALPDGAAVRVHHGTAEAGARLALVSTSGGDGKVSPGATAFAQLRLQSPLAARRGDRFILRRPSPVETLGGGRVLDAGRGRLRAGETGSLAVLAGGSDADVAALLLREAGAAGLTAPALARRLGASKADAEATVRGLVAAGTALYVVPGVAADSSAATAMREGARRILKDWRGSGAPSASMPRGEFLARLARGLDPHVAEGWLTALSAAGELSIALDRVGPPGSGSPEVQPEAAGFAARVGEAYRAAGFEAPDARDLARLLGTKPAVVEGLVSHLIKAGLLVRLSPDLVVHRSTVEGAAARLEGVRGRTLGIAEFRDLLGLTRKSLIPLLEHFDQKKRTRRSGNVRVVE